MLITKQQDFEDFLNEANRSNVVAIDTEFLRDKTYWPKLCLLQMAIDNKFALVDPFKVKIDSLKTLLKNNKVVKLFHSPRQDIEILLNEVGEMPVNIFDTQIAAGFLGHSPQIGYGNLVQAELGTKLKKGDTYTDWSLRPLSNSQLDYAKDDVVYLIELYHKMTKELKSLNRLNWVIEDINEKYLDRKLYEISPDDRYLHLKRASTLTGRQLACAKELASWRENTAIKRNIPRRWVLSDEQIHEICKKQPKTIDDLFMMRGAKPKLNTNDARSILKAVEKGNKVSKEDLAKLKVGSKLNIKPEKFSEDEIEAETELMCAVVRHRAKENNISPQTLSSNYDISKIAFGANSGIPTLSGWRKKIVGNELLDLRDGKISLRIDKGQLVIERNKNV